MQKFKKVFCIFVICVLWAALQIQAKTGEQQSDSLSYTLETEYISMSDDIKLATDVYMPLQDGRYPTILVRTPYDKNAAKGQAEWYTKNGYVVISQDCRGKLLSEGVFYPFQNEREDGLTTVEWIRSQSWSNGQIAGWGGSYVGYTQWAISDVLDVVTAELTSANIYELLYLDGLFSLATAFNWGLIVDSKTVNPIPPQKIFNSYTILPLSVADDSTYKDNAFINDWLAHNSYDDYWKAMNHRGITNSAVISFAGWYDIFLMPQIEDFIALNKEAKTKSRLIVGPWCHGSQSLANDYGGSEKTGRKGKFIRQFINAQLKGSDIDVAGTGYKDKKFNLFVMERNEYFGCDVWPPKSTKMTEYFIGPDAYFSPIPPQSQGPLNFTYDPDDPFPNKGGTFLGPDVGAALQNDNLSRTDQVTFETAALDSSLILLGPISATLYVGSDAPSTDFIVCLQDVFPNGDIVNIQEGGKRVEMKNGVNKVDLSVWATGYQLAPEHKLRAVITSSWFPRFNRNLNSGEPIFSAKNSRIAQQTIYYGDHPSSITLPVLHAANDEKFKE
jgi:uncharacterized protein